MTRSRYRIFEDFRPHFCTCTVVGWLPIFTRTEVAQFVLDSWKFLIDRERLTVYGYVIMENHLHFIASSTGSLGKEIGDFKSFTARQIIDRLKAIGAQSLLDQLAWHKARHKSDREHQLWQEGSHPEEISSDHVMWQKLEYTHNNPIRRGYVDDPVHWRYSSARNYAGQDGLLQVKTDWS
jgi:putative transposase